MPVLDNPRHERWCQLVAAPKRDGSIISDTEAYQIAYGSSYETAHTNAWTLRADQGLAARIKELQEPLEAKRKLTLERTYELLHDIAVTPIGEIDEGHPLAQAVKRSPEGNVIEVKMPAKLDAITLNAKLQGWLAERGDAGGVMININLLGADLPMKQVMDVEPQEG